MSDWLDHGGGAEATTPSRKPREIPAVRPALSDRLVEVLVQNRSISSLLGAWLAVVVGFGEAVRVLVRDDLIEPEPEERLLRVVLGCGIRATAWCFGTQRSRTTPSGRPALRC